jgi:phospholipase D3/4
MTSLENQAVIVLNGEAGRVFLTGSPPELCTPGRTTDLDGLVATLRDAQRSICVSVMTYSAVSRYRGIGGDDEDTGDIWWPVLNDELLRAAITCGVHVRMLVSHRTYDHPRTVAALRALKLTADAAIRENEPADRTAGRLEIRFFRVPGWDETAPGPDRRFPGHSRVNHPKFVVTDRRLHISTSNMTWDYFSRSAGCSFNTDHCQLVTKAQEIFDRDWSSCYAFPLDQANSS